MKNEPVTKVTLSNPPTRKASKPTAARPSVQAQSILGVIPNTDNSHPTPMAMSRMGRRSVFLPGFIVDLRLAIA